MEQTIKDCFYYLMVTICILGIIYLIVSCEKNAEKLEHDLMIKKIEKQILVKDTIVTVRDLK